MQNKELSAGTNAQSSTEADNSTSASVEANPMLSAALSVEEGNKLIAIFMGERVRSDYMIEVGTNFFGLGTKTLHRMEYHSSWDWLMPVVEKIEGVDSNIFFQIQRDGCYYGWVKEGGYVFEPRFVKGKTKINAVWLAVVEFIKWYNLNTAAVGSR